YVPPLNFSLIEDSIYRSGHPVPINFKFLKKLNLKTIIYIGDKEDNYLYYKWIKEEKKRKNGLNFYYFKFKSCKEPFLMNDSKIIIKTINLILNPQNYPILIHSNKGKHRIGVLVGILRKLLQNWSLSGIFNEYAKFSGDKGDIDLEFIENFNPILFKKKSENHFL
ncbi:Oca2p, partial [Ascoidea rubescens DSM 1968]